MTTLRIYRRILAADLRGMLEYRTDALIAVAAAILTQIAGLVFLGTIFRHVPVLTGWSPWEVILCYGLVVLGEGVGSLFFEGTWHLATMINFGFLDRFLVRPYPVLLQVTGAVVGLNGLGNILLGVGLLAAGLAHVDISWSPARVGWALILVASAILVKLALNLTTNTVSFWLVSPSSAVASAVHAVGDLARYPLSIYGTGLKAVLTVFPLGFVGYFPAASLLQKDDVGVLGALTPVVSIIWTLLSLAMFRAGLRRYESAGGGRADRRRPLGAKSIP
jgi:ABC-2 type transport system permease protein